MSINFSKHDTILFIGDSITDCGRRLDIQRKMGNGYVFILYSWLSALYSELELRFINKGISGNRVRDLLARWKKDCLKFKPNIISILIGVNDTWRRFDLKDPTSPIDFEKDYKNILEQTQKNIQSKLVLCEPFLLSCGNVTKEWHEDLEEKIKVVHKLAADFNAILVPLNQIFLNAVKKAPPQYWAEDGVHPTPAGHALIAQSWIKYVLKEPNVI
jgi:lysophospholipase L1-like esterase